MASIQIAKAFAPAEQERIRFGNVARGQRVSQENTSIRGECVIHVGDNCFAIFVEVMLPYTATHENYSFENVQ